jgi:hypothetical protein
MKETRELPPKVHLNSVDTGSDRETNEQTEAMRSESKLEKRRAFIGESEDKWRQLKSAIKSVGWIVVIATSIGITLVVLSKSCPRDSIPRLLLEDIGLGLTVAGISVFGFEWLSHLNTALKKIGMLEAALCDVVRLTEDIKKLTTLIAFLEKQSGRTDDLLESLEKASGSSFSVCLAGLFSESEEEKKFQHAVERIIKHALELKRSKTRLGQQYLMVIFWFLERAARYTHALAEVVRRDTDARWIYRPPRSTDVASQILAHHMKAMSKGDRYDTLSSVRFWTDDRMKHFFDETVKALDRGVKVRRLFNLGGYEDDAAKRLLQEKSIADALRRHTDLAARVGERYQVRFMTKPTADEIFAKLQKAEKIKDITNKESFYCFSFGLFHHKAESGDEERTEVVRFRAIGEDISELRIRYVGYADEDEEGDLIFDEMWELCPSNMRQFAHELRDPYNSVAVELAQDPD